MDAVKEEIAQICARLIAEEGLGYGAAKQRAVRQLGLPQRTALPANDQVEAALEEYLALFCSDTQPGELRALRNLALVWMRRMEAFSPQLSGAVWRGTATRLNDIHIQLYCDDPKAAELALIDQGVRYDVQLGQDAQGRPYDVLSIQVMSPALGGFIGVHLSVRTFRERHGTLIADSRGRSAEGGIAALQKILESENDV